MANIAAMGIKPTGSALQVVLNAQNQITIDQIIEKTNTEQAKRYVAAEAEGELRAGDRAVKSGYSRGFATILGGVSKFALYQKGA